MTLMFSPLKVERIYIMICTFNFYQSQIFFVSQKLMIDECIRIKNPDTEASGSALAEGLGVKPNY